MNPRLLLVEDDAVTAAFLAQALAPLPVQLALAADLAQARALADGGEALWLFDARLPDGRGDDLLASLRARGFQVPALALTAEDEPGALARLHAAGFVEVLAKPIQAEALRRAVTAAMLPPGRHWDDAAAHAALGGDTGSVQALRRLFVRELPVQATAVSQAWAARDEDALHGQLHRLKASCAFVGAAALLASVRGLQQAPADPQAHARFQSEAASLLSGPLPQS